MTKTVTEYQAQVLIGEDGSSYQAAFPAGVENPTQYGPNVKAQVVYDSQVQMIPVDRIAEDFADNADLPISTGFVKNVVMKSSELLEDFVTAAKKYLKQEPVLNVDEIGINIAGKRQWLHTASSEKWTLIDTHNKRGKEAFEEIGIIPNFEGVLCHDHWSPYLSYECKHSLCNAHHLRELERAKTQDNCKWAESRADLLVKILNTKKSQEGNIDDLQQKKFVKRYRKILNDGDIETPPPAPKKSTQKDRTKKSKARNLLERLREYEDETLLFMTRKDVPFTNNLAERDIRMTKVQQKISGCFRSSKGAKAFARIRSFISTCGKRGISRARALTDLFHGTLPDFVSEALLSFQPSTE